jgi:hypothetical protein
MSDVFLSYARPDRVAADLVLAHLQERGRSVFVDRIRLQPNQPWEPAIKAELRAARCVLVLWSETSVESSWVRSEADSGFIRGRLVQVLIEAVTPPEPFTAVQAVDLVDWPDDAAAGLQILTEAVDATLRLPAGAPDLVAQELDEVVSRLDTDTPTKVAGKNILIATWNLRILSAYTNAWIAGPQDTPKRDLRALAVIAEIVRRFDVMILQELGRRPDALHYLLSILGNDWAGITFDASGSSRGDQIELTGVVYDTRRLTPSGTFDRLSTYPGIRAHAAFERSLLHPPYIASFESRTMKTGAKFRLVVVRVKYGEAQPAKPVLEFARWLRTWAEREVESGGSILIAGDFGLGRGDDPAYRAFRKGGLAVVDELLTVPRSVFSRDPSDADHHFVDHIAWMTDDAGASLTSLRYAGRAGYFDFVGALPGHDTVVRLSWTISDHYPLWIELNT